MTAHSPDLAPVLTPSRRSVVRGAAWTLPAVLTATAAPSSAASPQTCVPSLPPANTAKATMVYPSYAYNHEQTTLDTPFFIDLQSGSNGFVFSGNTETVGPQVEAVVAPYFEVDIRSAFGRLRWMPNDAAFAQGWRVGAVTGPRRKNQDRQNYYTYRFYNTGTFTNVGELDPLTQKFQFGAMPQDYWSAPPRFGSATPQFNTYFRWYFPTRYRDCDPSGVPVMRTQTIVREEVQVTTPNRVYLEHLVEWVVDWDPFTGLPL